MGAVGHVLVFTFPGQGSQRAGMGEPWVDHPSWEVVEEASAAADRDLSHLLLHAPIEELTQTENAQLATTVLSLVVLDAVERIGLTPAACAGHSLGEYTALVASGSLGFDHGIQLVVARGEAMARAGEEAPGTMAALLGIADDDAEAACMRAEGDVWVANYNAPGQVVIAGTAEAVARAGELAKGLGAKRVMPIQVSGAFHTPLMQGARADLRKALAGVTFLTPEVRVVANVDAHVHDDPADWPGLLSAQLCSPVRWRQTLETFAGLGLTSLVELGPGGVLSGLAKRSLPEIQSLAVSKPEDLDTLMDQIGAAGTWRAEPALHQGEHLYMSERVVVSPSSGIFSPESSLQAPGTGLLPGTDVGSDHSSAVDVGELIGRVGISEVRTPFAGQVIGWLAADGERVQEGQPLAWLRVPDAALMAVILVTGGTRGIGAACVAWFLANGDQVATTYRSADAPEPPVGADPTHFLAVRCDVRNSEEVDSAFGSIEERWGPVQVLVANAGITMDSLMLRMSDQAFHDVIDANLTGSFRVAKRAVAKMLRLHTGRIVFVSSVGAFVGLPGQANYAASKAGLVGMARAIAREVGSRQITVNVVAPGLIDTDMTAALGADRVALVTGQVPLGRAGSPADVAAVVGFLASDSAAYVTGAVVPVDGGLGMGL